ncbi:hypothetical protein [Phycicoccus sp. Soil802]|uniref:hypothetical protein n=1 Tax=Phycicoccus sp. Soil802 TaxID=1736414 RepID=UPI000702D48F|nr:hypothetical protein [Phycicoccus sp. Soil802]
MAYFDMNVWVEMARGQRMQDVEWNRAITALHVAVTEARLAVALSAAHYLELWHRRDMTSREAVGAVMRDVTGYAALSPIQRVRRLEIEALVDRHMGGSRRVSTQDLLGQGVVHAFDSPDGRFRFVASIETSERREGEPAAAPDVMTDLRARPALWEWVNLVGTQDFIDGDWVDRTPEHRLGDRYAQQQLRLRQRVRDEPLVRARLRDHILVEEVVDVTDEINRVCVERDVDPHGLFFKAHADSSPEAVRRFVEELPSVDASVSLRWWKHKDLGMNWEQHDKVDLMSLAVAAPYADVVVTERRWEHLLRASGLAKRHKTIVGRGVDGVWAALELAGTARSE